MAVEDWDADNRWLIAFDEGMGCWEVSASSNCYHRFPTNWYSDWKSAHDAYLDAVTCEALTPFPNYTKPRCTRSRGHKGGHWFTGKNGMTDLEQMPK